MKFEEFFHDIVITMYENIRDLEEKRAFADPEERDYTSLDCNLRANVNLYL